MFVCLRQTLPERPSNSCRPLAEYSGYTYGVFVTTVPFAAELVSWMYADRTDYENRIKELKKDLNLDTFCLSAVLRRDQCLSPHELRVLPSIDGVSGNRASVVLA